MIKRIRVLKDIPGICPVGEFEIPTGVVDWTFAGVLIAKGLAISLDPPMPEPKKKGRRR